MKVFDLLKKMIVPKKNAISNVSDFITTNTGWSASSISAIKLGNILFVEIVIQKNNWAINTVETVGTIKSEFRPLLTAPMCGSNVIGMISSGELYVRNLVGSATSTGQRICGVLILGGGVRTNLTSAFTFRKVVEA